jgi:FKBP-type peptidyl-prolyl cis-trans isomerase 2
MLDPAGKRGEIMKQAKKGDKVKVHYTGKLDDGKVFDTSKDKKPFEFNAGKGEVIEGFDDAVVGMKVGEKRNVKVPPEKAYGPHRKEGLLQIPRGQFPAKIKPQVGQRLDMKQQTGDTITVIVSDVSSDSVTLDANHPLAGKNLNFEIELLEVV